MAKTKLSHRAFALSLALLFLVTSLGFSAMVLWQLVHKPKTDQATNQPTACQFGEESGSAEPVPDTFKPDGAVTSLQQTDLKEGTGASAASGSCLVVKYNGTFATSGEKFDGNFDQPTLLKFPLGQGAVIPGWDQGLVGMKVGGLRRLVIPAALGYGSSGTSGIPPNSDLVFVVELVKIEP